MGSFALTIKVQHNAALRQLTPQVRSQFWLLKPASEHAHARLLSSLSLCWNLLLSGDTYRKSIRSITDVLFPFATYLLTLPHIFNIFSIFNGGGKIRRIHTGQFFRKFASTRNYVHQFIEKTVIGKPQKVFKRRGVAECLYNVDVKLLGIFPSVIHTKIILRLILHYSFWLNLGKYWSKRSCFHTATRLTMFRKTSHKS
jgi:uncharacterized membrane protein YqaE (UPF0057 family)